MRLRYILYILLEMKPETNKRNANSSTLLFFDPNNTHFSEGFRKKVGANLKILRTQ